MLVLLPLAASATEPQRTVDITIEKVDNFDLGINGGEISPDGTQVLIFGEDGYAHSLSAKNADDEATDVRLENETTNSSRQRAGTLEEKSALLVGSDGPF